MQQSQTTEELSQRPPEKPSPQEVVRRLEELRSESQQALIQKLAESQRESNRQLLETIAQMLEERRSQLALGPSSPEMKEVQEGLGSLASEIAALTQKSEEDRLSSQQTLERFAQGVDTVLRTTTEKVGQAQEKTIETLRLDQEKSVRRTRMMSLLTVGAVVLATTIVGVAIVAYLRFERRSGLATEIKTLESRKTELASQVEMGTQQKATLEASRAAISEQVETLSNQVNEQRLALKQMAEAQQAMSQAQRTATAEVQRAQALQDAFMFRAIPGQDGKVFVQVNPEAKPFLFQGKYYMQVVK